MPISDHHWSTPGRMTLAALCLAVASAGCTAPTLPPAQPFVPPAPAAEQVEYAHDVLFATDQGEPSAEEISHLETFLGQLPAGASHRFRLVGHADERASEVYNLDLSARRARSVERHLRAHLPAGTEITALALGERAPPAAAGDGRTLARARRVEVLVSGYLVRLPECPDWSRDPGHDPQNLPLSNLGCANAVNLGLMVADPADLARGRPLGPADATREAEAVVRYQTDKVKKLREETLKQ